MKSAIVKRSIVLNGHKTSVSLENEFWDGLHAISDQQKTKLSALVQQIDLDRRNANLSSAIRIFVYNHFRGQAGAEQVPLQDPDSPTFWTAKSASVVR
jgi:predicted DNA-binding ribbon-helix-helix protein